MSSILIRRANIVSGSPPQPTEVDLTDLFTWTGGAYNSSGANSSNSVMKRSNEIDVSSYAGKTMKVTWVAYKTSTGGRSSGYGLFFYDANNTILYSERAAAATGVENNSGYSLDDYELVVPATAVKFKTIYFNTSVTFPVSAFSCKIML